MHRRRVFVARFAPRRMHRRRSFVATLSPAGSPAIGGAIHDARTTGASMRGGTDVGCGDVAVIDAVRYVAVRRTVRRFALCPHGAPGVTSGAPTFRRVSSPRVSRPAGCTPPRFRRHVVTAPRRRGAIHDARMTGASMRGGTDVGCGDVAVIDAGAVCCGVMTVRRFALCPHGAPGVTSGAPTFRRVSSPRVSRPAGCTAAAVSSHVVTAPAVGAPFMTPG